MTAYLIAIFLAGVLVGSVCGGAYVLREQRREFEQRMAIVRRYLTKDVQ